jgi:hypothetical protein
MVIILSRDNNACNNTLLDLIVFLPLNIDFEAFFSCTFERIERIEVDLKTNYLFVLSLLSSFGEEGRWMIIWVCVWVCVCVSEWVCVSAMNSLYLLCLTLFFYYGSQQFFCWRQFKIVIFIRSLYGCVCVCLCVCVCAKGKIEE